MSPKTHHYVFAHGLEIRFHQETEVVETMHGTRKPDISWLHFDKNHHAHAWDGDKLPTLGEVVTGKAWIGDEYDSQEIDVTEYRCLVCGEVVEPKYVVDYSPTYVQGPPAHTLMIRANIMDQEFRIPPEDVGPLIEILQRIFDRG